MAPRTPAARGFTLAERRSLTFERVALYAVFFVALVAAVISFVALRWLGEHLGLGWAANLVPLAIDGFAIACSVGIVRSQAAGEPGRERVSEWMGLFIALGLSILGNIQHVIDTGSPDIPLYLKYAFASAIPVIVAYGIHVYGRAMSRGISARVMADDPDKVHFDIRTLHDEAEDARKPSARATRAAAAQTARAARTQTVLDARAQDTSARAPQRETYAARAEASEAARAVDTAARAAEQTTTRAADDERARVRELFDKAVRENPHERPDAARLHREAGATANPATTRRWVQQWWGEFQADLDGEDRDSAQLDAESARAAESLRIVS